jgi:hypothetical protein
MQLNLTTKRIITSSQSFETQGEGDTESLTHTQQYSADKN